MAKNHVIQFQSKAQLGKYVKNMVGNKLQVMFLSKLGKNLNLRQQLIRLDYWR